MKHKLLKAFGTCIVATSPPPSIRLQVLNKAWKFATKFDTLPEYMELAEVYLQFVVKCFTIKEISIILRDVVQRIKTSGAQKDYQIQLGTMAQSIFSSNLPLETVFVSREIFLLLDLITEKDVKKGLCRSILTHSQS